MDKNRALESLSDTMYKNRIKHIWPKREHLENSSETTCTYRQEQNRARIAEKRASRRSPSETIYRQEQNRACIAENRALRSPSETIYRQEQNRAHIAKKRALRRSPSETIQTRAESSMYWRKESIKKPK